MGKTHEVPRSAKGESRILYIFSVKSLIATLGFGLIGLVVYYILSNIGLGKLGLGIMVAFAAIGFGLATLTIPDVPMMGKMRKAGRRKFRKYSL